VILFAWRRLPPPGFIGGAEISEGLVARALAAAGERVVFVGALTNPRDPSESWRSWLTSLLDRDDVAYDACDSIAYRWQGVECYAVPQREVLDVVRRYTSSAHLIWTSQEDCPTIRALAPDLPAASYAHSVSEVGLLSAQIRANWVFAPSRFVQSVIAERFEAQAELLRPPILLDALESVVRDAVLFVNPIQDKGVHLAIELARAFPSTRFVFVESWRAADADLQLPSNIVLLPRRPSLTDLYRRALLLLVPSVIEDACPRVILEAGGHGVPSLGSDRGGIPELIADPADVLAADDVGGWVTRCHDLLASPAVWSSSSRSQRLLVESLRQDPVELLGQLGLPVSVGRG
jgi:glycosyltransferase involved in cell wall biosynthesis